MKTYKINTSNVSTMWNPLREFYIKANSVESALSKLRAFLKRKKFNRSYTVRSTTLLDDAEIVK